VPGNRSNAWWRWRDLQESGEVDFLIVE